MDIVFLGTSDVGTRLYEWLCDRDNVDVRALLTRPEQLDLIEEIDPEMLVSIGFDYLVPSEILDIPDRGCVNLHGSYLPYNKRRNSNVWPIVEGTPAGVTLHYMNENLDEGEIIEQREIDISFEHTAKDVYDSLSRVSYELFTEEWPSLEAGEVSTRPQKDGGTTHTREDFESLCHIDLEETYTAREFIDILRATTFPPFDNAYVVLDGQRYFIDIDIRKDTDDGSKTTYRSVEQY